MHLMSMFSPIVSGPSVAYVVKVKTEQWRMYSRLNCRVVSILCQRVKHSFFSVINAIYWDAANLSHASVNGMQVFKTLCWHTVIMVIFLTITL